MTPPRWLLRGTCALVAAAGCNSSVDSSHLDATHPGDAPRAGDALGSDAGSGSAGRDLSSDRAKFFGASRCAALGAQLCEDFESGTLDTGTWSVVGTAPVIDTIQAARGTHALHITMPGNGASYIKEKKTFPEAGNAYFGRAFIYFNKLPTTASMTYAHWTVIAGTTDLGEIRVSGQMQNGTNLFGVGTDSGSNASGTGDWTNSDNDPAGAPRAVPTGQWVCLEWNHDGTANETHFWWDATAHPSLDTSATMHGGNTNPFTLDPFTAAWVGWQEYQTSTEPFEIWVDEIAIDSQRIGCVD